ncbi:hypothetical protein [Natroniella sp. ANB-PHB2]|uniref:hypothetical protein n=1 Tax=Natroniella sp. ANB-PHB2 TaxID=3384444 RepID=UPI0038D51380
MEVKTKEYLEKEVAMLNKCVNEFINGHLSDKHNGWIFYNIVSIMDDFYNNEEIPVKGQCSGCGVHVTYYRSTGNDCPALSCPGKIIVKGDDEN